MFSLIYPIQNAQTFHFYVKVSRFRWFTGHSCWMVLTLQKLHESSTNCWHHDWWFHESSKLLEILILKSARPPVSCWGTREWLTRMVIRLTHLVSWRWKKGLHFTSGEAPTTDPLKWLYIDHYNKLSSVKVPDRSKRNYVSSCGTSNRH